MLNSMYSRIKEALFPGSEAIALPTLDGALRANRRLDDAQLMSDTLIDCDDMIAEPNGQLLVSAGDGLFRLTAPDYSAAHQIYKATGRIGALATDGQNIYMAVAGQGVLCVRGGEVCAQLDRVDDTPLHCVTALTILRDGRVALTEGSAVNGLDNWSRDLLERRSHGRLIIASPDLSDASTLAKRLAWPAGLVEKDQSLWVSESWRHRVQVYPLSGEAPSTVLHNLPGYPARIAPADNGECWLCVSALRTQLVEFVLRERDYCDAMLESVDPRYWIAPSLSSERHYLEPLQGGAIKKLGIVKPWAPPRSYGLLLRLSSQGEIRESLHSRPGGEHHGITSAHPMGDQLLALSRGSGRLLRVAIP
tara:strand:- start:4644 stop:5732 length:1089 start_codon:yes stop_codon:yes gene_type:complete